MSRIYTTRWRRNRNLTILLPYSRFGRYCVSKLLSTVYRRVLGLRRMVLGPICPAKFFSLKFSPSSSRSRIILAILATCHQVFYSRGDRTRFLERVAIRFEEYEVDNDEFGGGNYGIYPVSSIANFGEADRSDGEI